MLSDFIDRYPVTIRARLIMAFVLIGLFSGTAFLFFTGIALFDTEQRESIRKLEAVATLKHAEIDYWIKNLHTNLALLFTETSMIEFADIVATQSPHSPDYQTAYPHLLDDFQHILVERTQFFDDVFLVNPQGYVVLSTDPKQEGMLVSDQDYFREGMKRDYIEPPFYSPALNHKSFIIVHPVVDRQGRPVCIIAGVVKVAILNEIMAERAGLGETGETYLVDMGYDMLTDSRFATPNVQPGSSRLVNTEGVRTALTLQANDSRQSSNYLGTAVLGAYRWLPDLKIVLVAEQSQAEALDSAYATLRANVGITSIVIFFALLIALQIVRGITAPLSDLAKTAAQITDGNLNTVAPVKRRDEIGAVAQAFNTMTGRLAELILHLQENVTALAQAKELITRNEAYFRSLIENAYDVIGVVNETGMVRYASPSVERVLGYTVDEIVGTKAFDWVHPADLPLLQKAMDTVLSSPQQYASFELRFVQKDGAEGVMGGIVRNFLADPAVQGIVVNAREITARKQAEQALRQSEKRLRLAQEAARIFAWEWRVGEVYITYTTDFFNLLGVSATPDERFEFADFIERIHPEDRKHVQAELERSMSGEPVQDLEFRVTHPEDRILWLASFAQPVFDATGKLEKLFGATMDITERKKAEQEIQTLARFPEENPNPVLRLDLAGVILYANKASQSLLQEWQIGIGQRVPLALYNLASDALTQQSRIFGEIACGQQIYSFVVAPIFEFGYVNLYGRDITERKRAEDALRASEKRLSRTQEIAHLGSWELDLVHNHLTWSDEAYRIFGFQPQEFGATYEAFLEAVHPDDRAAVDEAYSGSLREGRDTYEIEHRVVRKSNNEIRFVHEKCEHIRDASGKIIQSIGMTHDITERIQAEVRLRQLFSAVEQNPASIVITDPHGNIEYVNPKFTEITGYAFDEALGQNPRILKSGETPPQIYEQLWNTITAGEDWRGELLNKKKNGEFYWESVSISPIIDANSQITHYVAVKLDITERRHAEEALKTAHTMVVNEKNRLLAVMEALPIGVAIVDSMGGRIETNHAYERVWGKPRPKVDSISDYALYKAWWVDTGKPIQPEEWASAIAVQKGESTIGQLLEIERFDETHAFVLNSGVPILDAQNNVIGAAVAIMDITARMKAEQALREARDELEIRVRERTAELEQAVRQLETEITERKRVAEQARQNAARSETLIRIAARLNAQLDLTTILNLICEETAHALNVPASSVALYDEPTDTLGVVSMYGLPPEFSERLKRIPRAVYEEYVCMSESVSSKPDIQILPELVNADLYRTLNLRSLGTAQLGHQEKLIGELSIFTVGQIREFSQDELALLQGIANQATLAITNAQQFNAEQYARQISEVVCASNLALTQSLDLATVLGTLLENLGRLIPYTSANVMLLEDKMHIAVRATRGYEPWSDPADVSRITFNVQANPILLGVISNKKSVLITDTENYPGWERLRGVEHVRNWLGVPLIAGGDVIGIYSMDQTVPGFFTQEHQRLAETLTAQAAIAIQNAWLFDQVRSGRERLQLLARQLVEVQESERRHVAHELHDEAGQALASLVLGLRLLAKETHNPKAVTRHVTELSQITDGVLENLHRLAMDLRPVSLDHLGLNEALRQHIETIRKQTGWTVKLETKNFADVRLPPATEMAIYRIVQEALSNAVRHSHATRIHVRLGRRDESIVITVEDNGVGFDPANAFASGRLGLVGMRERAEMFGGTLNISSVRGKGTVLTVEVPYANSHPDR